MDGTDGIQCNMTNTMNTPIEEVERTLPLMITKYEFRPDSSGAGQYRGGSGIVRSFLMLADETTFTVLADRERHAPWGLLGGLPGGTTEVLLRRRGRVSRVPAKTTLTLRAGDEVTILTAGGGGYGTPRMRLRARVEKDVEDGLVSRAEANRRYRESDELRSRRLRRGPPSASQWSSLS
jgi:N-methylhydantoinase B